MLQRFLVTAFLPFLAIPLFAQQKTKQQQLSKLLTLIDQADEMVVYSEGFRREFVIYRSTTRKDFEEFKTAITLKRGGGPFVCACVDGPEISLLRNKKEIAAIWNHEGTAIGSSVWEGDWENADPDRWLKWFDARKIGFARQEYEAMKGRERRAVEDETRWRTAMPSSLKPLWSSALSQYEAGARYPDLNPLNAALLREYPDVNDRIRALLAWYGSGAGPWSGFPAYEEIAEKILRQYPTAELIRAVEGKQLSEQHIEGAARILAGWTPDPDLTPIPSELREILLNHCLKSEDQDKVARANKAFSSDR